MISRYFSMLLVLLFSCLLPCSSFLKPGLHATFPAQHRTSGRLWPSIVVAQNQFRARRTAFPLFRSSSRAGLRMGQGSDDAGDAKMSQLQKRVSELKDRLAAEDEELKFNWRAGLMSQDPMLVLDDWIRGACFHEDTVAVGTYSGMVLLADTSTGEIIHVLAGHDGVGADTRKLANGAILADIYDTGIGPITAVDWDGVNLVTAGTDGAVRHWEVQPGKPRSFAGSLVKHEDVVTAVKLSSHSSFWSACLDGFVRSWQQRPDGSWSCDCQLNVGKPVLSLACSEDWIVVGAQDGTLVLFEVVSRRGMMAAREVSRWQAHEAPVRAVALGGTEGEERVYSGCHGSWRIKVWELPVTAEEKARKEKAREQSAKEEEEEEERAGQFGVRMYDEFAVNQGRMLQLREHFPLATMKGHRGPVVALAPLEEYGLLISAAHDGTVRAWDLKSEECLYAIGGHTAYLTSLQVDRGRCVVDGTNNVLVEHNFLPADENGEQRNWRLDPEGEDSDR